MRFYRKSVATGRSKKWVLSGWDVRLFKLHTRNGRKGKERGRGMETGGRGGVEGESIVRNCIVSASLTCVL